jgi:uncharacterized protein (DUF362 family)
MRIHIGSSEGEAGSEELRTAFDRIGLSDHLSRVSKIFVKPNFTFPRHQPGVTTTPEFLGNVLSLLREGGAEVFVGESNGGYGSFLAEQAFSGHRLSEICDATNVEAANLSQMESRTYSETIAGRTTSVVLPRFLVEDVDLTVSVPVLKVHVMTTISLSVKNLWGCSPVDLRLLQHAQLDRKLRLISHLTKARFGIVDATYGLDKHGPMDGESRHLGKFVAGDELYGLDWITSKMMGFNPRAIRHLRMIPRSSLEDIRRKRVESNVDPAETNWGFRLGFNMIDTLSLASFHSDTVARLVFNSPLTKPIYSLFGRKPRRRLS